MLKWLAKPLLVIYAFLFIIFVHELGHYIIARLFRLKIAEFSIGIGPVNFLPKIQDRRGTIWRFGLLPIGGYVRPMHRDDNIETKKKGGFISNILDGLDAVLEFIFRPLQKLFNSLYDPVDEKLVKGRKYVEDLKPLQLIALAGAGPLINFILSGLILTCLYHFSGRNFVQVEITSDYKQFQVGDKIESVNQIQCASLLAQFLFPLKGIAKVKRGQEIVLIEISQLQRDKYKIVNENRKPLNLLNSAQYSINDISLLAYNYLVRFLNFKKVLSKMGGPVSIIREGIKSSNDSYSFFSWVILISLVLGVFNLLPIPPLDGGRILLGFLHIISPKRYHKFIDDLFNDIALLFVLTIFLLTFKSDIIRRGILK